MTRWVGVDIGGTNTDLVFVDTDAGRLVVAKVPTTAHDQAEGLVQGIEALGVAPGTLDFLVHGTTVATNAAIERKGARCGLIATAGFRDVLELRRRDRPHTYGLTGNFAPLIERRFRREVTERVSAEGEILVALDLDDLERTIIALRDAGCEVLVIAFLHSYANTSHERAAGALARRLWPNPHVVLSSDILPALREFERTSTAAISGYVQPLIARYLDSLGGKLGAAGFARDLLVVQSNGGVMAAPLAIRFAANTILSGPAAGVAAASSIARELAIEDAVSCDMGGTSLDTCVIRGGVPGTTQQKVIDFGLPLALPMLDVDAIGAGGGSLARIDNAGILQVGPESAGASPGPVCYGRGGAIPTVTDASLVLGLLQPDAAIGRHHGSGMDRGLAREAIERMVARPLGLDPEKGAEAMLTLTGAKMAGHLRRKLLERGLDPRQFSVIAFGGAGPVHANRIMREVGLARAVIPYYPGITSALGCILGRLRHDMMRTVNKPASSIDAASFRGLYADQTREALEIVAAEGLDQDSVTATYGADMCYRGQSNVLPVTFAAFALPCWETARPDFERSYRERFGRLLDGAEVMLINIRTTLTSRAEPPAFGAMIRLPTGPVPEPEHTGIYFDGRWRQAALHQRLTLPAGAVVPGPALLLQPDSTCFVEPGYHATVHPTGNILIEAAP
jgi:N-methylhydantoinase A